MKTFYIVPHSHLDREWYRAFQENRIKLVHFMDDLLEVMETNPEYTNYLLDAQTSFIDDYLDVKPEQKEKFKKYVQKGNLPIGPWYVQPDEHLPTAEGIIRNLLISRNISEEYGDFLHLGYAPDAFGQSSSFPTLMKGFGIDSAIFYRGFAESSSKYNDFIWEGIDDSQIMATWMPIGYGNAMFLNEDDANNINVIEENMKLLTERNISSEHYLLMCGSDQSYVKKFLPQTVKRLNELYKEKGLDYQFKLASPIEYMNALRPYQDHMEVIHGELRKGKRSRTHNSIGATRMDIKQQNFAIEGKYLHVLEPISSLGNLHGITSDKEIINRGWKYIVENHAHDSICCCCTDIIHKELKMRMVYADQIAEYLIKEKFEKLHQRICYNKDMGRPILLFSSYLGERYEMVDVDIYVKNKDFVIVDSAGNELIYQIHNVEPFNLKDTKVSFTPIPDDFYDKVSISVYVKQKGYGYQTIYIRENSKPTKLKTEIIASTNTLENKYIKLSIKEDGTWDIVDKARGITYENQHIIVDDGNAGDEYDYSPSFKDQRFDSIGKLKDIKNIKNTPLETSLQITYEMAIPKTTSNEERSRELVTVKIKTIVTLRKYDRQLYIKTTIDNTAKNHRIQVLFDLHKTVKTNFADVQLGEIIRDNAFDESSMSISENWHEYYYPVFNQHKYSGLKDQDTGFIVMNKGLPQYEIYNEKSTKLGITLLSCVGNMGNTDLKFRPGRRSGSTDATPDSQMLGKHTLEYSFLPISEGVDYLSIAEQYVNPIFAISYPEYSGEGNLPDMLQIASSDDGLLATSFKVAEKEEGYVLRVVNPYSTKKENIKLTVNRFLFRSVNTVNLAEEAIEDKRIFVKKLNNPDGSDLAVMSGEVTIEELNHNQPLSLLVK